MTGTDLEVQGVEIVPAGTLFGTDNPAEVVRRSTDIATELARLVRKQNLLVRIGQSEHVRVEGWTLLGSMLGVFAVVEWTRPVLDADGNPIGWEARVEARTLAGNVVSAAEAECLRDERTWSKRDDYALRSMAQTRAVSKALRLVLGFVMQLAGFDPTPADEMPTRSVGDPQADRSSSFLSSDTVSAPVGGEAPSPTVQASAGSALAPPSADPAEETLGASSGRPDDPRPATAPQKKKLDVLVANVPKKIGDEPQHFKRRLYRTISLKRVVGMDDLMLELGAIDADGVVHWSPLRESLTRTEAHLLIDKLEALGQ